MKPIKSRLVRMALWLTTGTMLQIDLCPNIGELMNRSSS